MRHFIIWLFCFLLTLPVGAIVSAHAGDKAAISKSEAEPKDCADGLAKASRPYWQIVSWMADYRAAIDAGYEGCADVYPKEFKGTVDIYKFWQAGSEEEFSLGRHVAASLTSALVDDEDYKSCETAASSKAETINKQNNNFIDGLYRKAYKRRLKAISEDGLSGDGKGAVLEFGKSDSCKFVLTALENYRKYYDRADRAKYALFTFATKYSTMAHRHDSATKRAIAAFKDALEDADSEDAKPEK